MFNRSNTLTLIPTIDVSGRPLAVYDTVRGNPKIRCGGSYVEEDSKWIAKEQSDRNRGAYMYICMMRKGGSR